MSLEYIIDKLKENCDKSDLPTCDKCIVWDGNDCLINELNHTFCELIESQNKLNEIINR